MLGEQLPDSVSVVVRLKTVDSTMDYAKKIAHFPQITIVLAKEQYRGKGRWGRKWVSPRGGLWFSLILSCIDPDLIQFRAGLATCLAIRELFNIDVEVRWPNDIVFRGKKLGGILVEHVYDMGKCIVGVGVNVNNRAPSNAVSLSEILGHEISIEEILAKIVERFGHILFLSKKELTGELERVLYGVGRYILAIDNRGENFMGIFCGICRSLGLCLELLDGKKVCLEVNRVYRVYWI